jgi:exodeoxyribonuclease VII small subunit
MQQTENPASFEAVYRQLEEAVRRLEEGGLTLDEAIALYEQGMGLARACQGLLEQAELKITTLQELYAAAADAHDDDEDE